MPPKPDGLPVSHQQAHGSVPQRPPHTVSTNRHGSQQQSHARLFVETLRWVELGKDETLKGFEIQRPGLYKMS